MTGSAEIAALIRAEVDLIIDNIDPDTDFSLSRIASRLLQLADDVERQA